MGEDYPFYGLQAMGLNGSDEPLRDVKEIALHYINAIRDIQTRDSYPHPFLNSIFENDS